MAHDKDPVLGLICSSNSLFLHGEMTVTLGMLALVSSVSEDRVFLRETGIQQVCCRIIKSGTLGLLSQQVLSSFLPRLDTSAR